jgi:hypothetical protein
MFPQGAEWRHLPVNFNFEPHDSMRTSTPSEYPPCTFLGGDMLRRDGVPLAASCIELYALSIDQPDSAFLPGSNLVCSAPRPVCAASLQE